MTIRSFILILLLVPFTVQAEDKGYMGFSIKTSISGIFKPKLKQVLVKEVITGSPADKAGLKPGNQIIEIDGCKIPGCPVEKAKSLMNKKKGNALILLIATELDQPKEIKITAE